MKEGPKTPEAILTPLEEFRAAHDSFQQTVRWIQNGNPSVPLPHPAETFEEQLEDFKEFKKKFGAEDTEVTHEQVVAYRIEHFLEPLFRALITWSAKLSAEGEYAKEKYVQQAEVERMATLVLEGAKMAVNKMPFGSLRTTYEEQVAAMSKTLIDELSHGFKQH